MSPTRQVMTEMLIRLPGHFFKISLNHILCAPMNTDKDTVGIIELINKKGGGQYFSENDIKIIQSVASQISRGIETYRLKEEKMKADRLATIGNMMSTIVHDLRTPMNNIYGFVDLMLEEDDIGNQERICGHYQ